MMNKKGSLVLRDVVFMMLIVSAIFVFAGLFVSEMSLNYENTNMTDEWGISKTNDLASSMLEDTSGDMESAGDSLGTGIWDLVIGGLKSIGGILEMVVTAPNTIGNLVSGTLVDIGIPSSMGSWIGYLISGILWAVIIFTIYSSFLKGGKL